MENSLNSLSKLSITTMVLYYNYLLLKLIFHNIFVKQLAIKHFHSLAIELKSASHLPKKKKLFASMIALQKC